MLGFFTLGYSPPICHPRAHCPCGWPACQLNTNSSVSCVPLLRPSSGQGQDLQLVYPMSSSFKNKMLSCRLTATLPQIIICRLKYQSLLTITLLCYRIYNLTVCIHQTKQGCILTINSIHTILNYNWNFKVRPYYLIIPQKLSKSDYTIPIKCTSA